MNRILEEKKLKSGLDKMAKNEVVFNLDEDLNEISHLIKAYIDEKYIGTLKSTLGGYRTECEHNLCKEAQLIQALIPFLPNESGLLELVVSAMVYNDMIEKCFGASSELSSLYRDENKQHQEIKKLAYKVILFKLITMIEKMPVKELKE